MNRKELRAWWKFNCLPTTCRECHLVGLCRVEYEDWKLHSGFCFLESIRMNRNPKNPYGRQKGPEMP